MSESILKFPMNVTFDTNIFDDCQMDLSENSPFYQLVRYAQQGKIKVYVSNIVYQEMKQHCIEYSEKVCAKIRRTGKDILKGKLEDKTGHRISKAFIDAIDLSYILRIPDEESAKQLSERYLSDFFEKIHVEMLDSQDVNVDSIFDSYFQKKPPFENSDKKKSEFPDAVIAAQIQAAFDEENPVYVVSKDNGFTEALSDSPYCLVYSSLNNLFKMITEHEDECDAIKSLITSKLSDIQIIIDRFLDDENNITLEGLSCDNDGIQSGFDYEEIYINSHKMISTELFSLDNFDNQTIYATIRCVAYIEAECFYYDYDNSVWDSEEKEYIFLESHTNIEEHKARFACSVSINRETKEIQLAKCHVYLGGDSLVKRNGRKSKPYTTCPDCGEDISIDNDGGNGFCNKCAPNH